jgi:6-phosphogluconolactonase/glucosamine-6-phosphate isomerase/deaminase
VRGAPAPLVVADPRRVGELAAELGTLDGSVTDLAGEAARHDAVLEAAPIDVAVLGLGRDGHVPFGEPPAKMASGVRVVDLVAATREDAWGVSPAPSSITQIGPR